MVEQKVMLLSDGRIRMKEIKHKDIINKLYETLYEPWMDEQDKDYLRKEVRKEIPDDLLDKQIEHCIEVLKIPEDKIDKVFTELFHKFKEIGKRSQ
jgi:hypothetical protein